MPANRQGRVSPGDLTGRQKAQATRDQEKAAVSRQREITMATAVEDEEKRRGVFDPKSGARTNKSQVVDDYDEGEDEENPNIGLLHDEEPVLTGHEDPNELALQERLRPPPSAPPLHATTSPVEVAEDAEVIIRAESDVENMTYGMDATGAPNNFNFEEGKAYQVPLAVAQHMQERGLVRHIIRAGKKGRR